MTLSDGQETQERSPPTRLHPPPPRRQWHLGTQAPLQGTGVTEHPVAERVAACRDSVRRAGGRVEREQVKGAPEKTRRGHQVRTKPRGVFKER